jgi:type I restriction enzyme M protein
VVDAEIQSRLWAVADQLWANTDLKPYEFSTPVLGLIFLRYAETKFAEAEKKVGPIGSGGRRKISKADYQAEGVIFLRPEARFSYLKSLTEGDNIGRRRLRQDLRILPRQVRHGGRPEGRRVLHPHQHRQADRRDHRALPRRIFDPACGSGGMFVQRPTSSKTTEEPQHRTHRLRHREGHRDTVKLAKMNLAVHGLSGDIREANTYYEDPHSPRQRAGSTSSWPIRPSTSPGGQGAAEGRPPLPLRHPQTRQRQLPLDPDVLLGPERQGRAGFVMANSAGDARGSELEIRRS